MAIKPVCDKYKKELTEAGGLVFSTPTQADPLKRKKYHLCVLAWREFLVWHETCLSCNRHVFADEVAIAFEPPEDLTSAGDVRFYYIHSVDWPKFLEWLKPIDS